MKRAQSADNPYVSVILPCYNGEEWLPLAIESVLGQTFRDFELLLIDDGSTDSTLEVIHRYAKRDSRIVVIAKPHTNVSDTLNAGLQAARGVWAARLDQDDLCVPTRLAKQVEFVAERPDVIFVGSNFTRVDETGRFMADHGFPSGHRQLMNALERWRGFCPHSTAFFRVDAAREVGGYRARLNNANDHDLWLRLGERGELACVPRPLVLCRGHSRQMSHFEGGEPQVVECIAGSVCHFLRVAGDPDPLDAHDATAADGFLAFVRERVHGSGMLRRRKAWAVARAEYFKKGSVVRRVVGFTRALMRTGAASALLREKLQGFVLPEEIAQEWRRRRGTSRAANQTRGVA